MKSLLIILLLGPLLAACGTNDDTVLDAQRESAATQVSALVGTTTLEAARLRTTLDYTVTRASLAATQGGLLELTLVARGTPLTVLQEFQREMMGSFATATPPPSSDGSLAGITGNNAPVPLVITPLTLPTPDTSSVLSSDGPRLESIVTSTGVDGNDCPVGTTNTFSTASPSIYVVARAINIDASTRLSSRWNRDGEQIITYEFTPNFSIDNACIWFFMEQSDVTFTPGEWNVQLDINGTPAGLPITFTIRDAAGS